MKYLLQGRPFRHPLHPMLVHLPVALFPLSLIVDVCALLGLAEDWAVRGAFYAMFAGVVASLVAAGPGFVDYLDIRRDSRARRVANWHMGLNLAVVAAYVLNLLLRWPVLEVAQPPVWGVVLSVAGVMVLMFSGYLGGILVYDDGVAVGRHRRKAALPSRTLEPTGSPDAEGFIVVAESGELAEGHTLRVKVSGVVVALARVGGQVHAFQEFCTHRFGPLSEGCFVNGQVECPWHRSRFDVRTGKVTEGPARVDLKSFAAREADGRIHVRAG